jgi:hypothetical protein
MTPEWPGTFENYARKDTKRNFWRVKHVCGSEEDALQECGVTFAKVRRRYTGKVHDARHWMALYKTALSRQWDDLANREKRLRALSLPEPEAVEPSYAPLAAYWHSASDELRCAIAHVVNAPAEVLDIIFADRSPTAINRRWRRFARIRGTPDLVGELRNMLS